MRHSVRFEDITDAADRVNQLRLERVVYFRAQPAYNYIDDVCISREPDAPDLLCDFGTRHHGADRTNQVRQEKKFLWRKVERNS